MTLYLRENSTIWGCHTALLPHELEQAGWKITERSEDSLPFRR